MPGNCRLAWATALALSGACAQPETAAPREGEPAPNLASSPAGEVGEINFDHSLHAGKYKIACLDCHVFADKSPAAGLPSGRQCMGCHKFVDKEKPAVQLLAKRVAAGESLRWQRVFAVPDFIYFSHRVHILKKVDCAECHGDMAAATTIQQDKPFTMGRCLACHEARGASRDCLTCHK